MVRELFRVSVCFRNNNDHRVANEFSDKHGLYNLYGLRFYVKEQFWGRHILKKCRGIPFCDAHCFGIRERILYADRDT